MQLANPYEAPQSLNRETKRSRLLFIILSIATVATALLSYLNAIQEPAFSLSAIGILVVVPTLVQLFGVATAIVNYYLPNRYTRIFTVPASLVAFLSVTLLLAWVIAGKFQNPRNVWELAANLFQIHPVAIPFSMLVASFSIYCLAAMTAFATFVFRAILKVISGRTPTATR